MTSSEESKMTNGEVRGWRSALADSCCVLRQSNLPRLRCCERGERIERLEEHISSDSRSSCLAGFAQELLDKICPQWCGTQSCDIPGSGTWPVLKNDLIALRWDRLGLWRSWFMRIHLLKSKKIVGQLEYLLRSVKVTRSYWFSRDSPRREYYLFRYWSGSTCKMFLFRLFEKVNSSWLTIFNGLALGIYFPEWPLSCLILQFSVRLFWLFFFFFGILSNLLIWGLILESVRKEMSLFFSTALSSYCIRFTKGCPHNQNTQIKPCTW